MAQKVLIDVNICLDVLLDRKPFVEYSGPMFERAENGNIDVMISGLSFDTLFYIMRPEIGATKTIQKLKQLLVHLDVGVVDIETVKLALDSGWKDLEDALHYFCAVQADCNSLITRNKKDFEINDPVIEVLTPQEFIEEM